MDPGREAIIGGIASKRGSRVFPRLMHDVYALSLMRKRARAARTHPTNYRPAPLSAPGSLLHCCTALFKSPSHSPIHPPSHLVFFPRLFPH